MRKPRDYGAELKALDKKTKELKLRKQNQLGQLVIATGADELSIEELAGALLGTAAAERPAKEVWRKRGAAFFRGERTNARGRTGGEQGSAAKDQGGATSPRSETGAT